VLEQHLAYADLKASARNGLEFSFVPGASLWAQAPGGPKAAPCAKAGPSCESFLNGSEKARLEAALEQAFARFEARAAAGRIVP
jgi:adenosine deaminase